MRQGRAARRAESRRLRLLLRSASSTVEPQSVTLTRELPGRTSAFRVAEVRARVNGIVLKRLFSEGSDVKAGQPLFRIDPAPYQAALESAQAQLARAEATVESAKSLAERYDEADRRRTRSVGRSTTTRSRRLKTAEADVAAARAAVEVRADQRRLHRTSTAPIAGRIGRSEVTEGAYVQQGTATLLATVQQLDTVYVDLTWSSAESSCSCAARSRAASCKAPTAKRKVTIVLEDGREYARAGHAAVRRRHRRSDDRLDRAARDRPESQGRAAARHVRARADRRGRQAAMRCSCPQRAVTRDQNGQPIALVVDKDGKVERRQLVTDRAIGDDWLVTKGLAAGEQVDRRGPPEGAARRDGEAGARRTAAASQARPLAMAQFFIDRPIFAWVIAIIIMIAGGISITAAAGLAVSGDRAARDHGQRDVSRRLGADARGHGHAGHRAADERPRRPALHLVVERLDRHGVDRAHVRAGHQSRHRAGAGAEQAAARDAAAAAGGAAPGRARREEQSQLPHDRRASSRETAA